jgi:myo-inositol 2-dehydrogenase/D-chiro-inositol 1-dehydrogenase
LRPFHDVVFDEAATMAERLGSRAVRELVDVLGDPAIDAFLIATSTDTHLELLKAASAAGKAIYCEKPIDLDLGRAREAAAAIEASGVPCMIGFNRRSDPNHAALRDAVRSGEVGRVEMVLMTNRGPDLMPLDKLRWTGGQFRDQTIHFFDLLRWITGDEPVEAFAMGACLVNPAVAELGDVDTSMVMLRMAGGALCQIDSSRRTAYGYDERIEVFGSTGMVESERQRMRGVSRYGRGTITRDGLHPGWLERIEGTYAAALDGFIEAIRDGRSPSPSIDDGLRAQLIAEAAIRSLKEGRPCPIDA